MKSRVQGGFGGSRGGALGPGGGVSSRGRNTTQWVDTLSVPSVIPDYDFDSPVRPDFLACSNKAMSLCYRRFGTSQEGFSECIYGFLVSSQLLPQPVAALATDVRLDVSGPFAEGASYPCSLASPGNDYPDMVNYF